MGSVKSKEMYFHDLIKNDKDREFFEILTKNKIDYNYCLRYNDYSLLGLAAYYGAIKIIEILTEKGADLNNQRNPNENTPLIIACIRNKVQSVNFLLKKMADTSIINDQGVDCLDVSILFGNVDVACLIILEANINMKHIDKYYELRKLISCPVFDLKVVIDKINEKVDTFKRNYRNRIIDEGIITIEDIE